jgi:hypothetical protein
MRDEFLKFKNAMTKEDLAAVLNIKPSLVGTMARAGKIPRIPGIRLLRFDPMAMIDIFCAPKAAPAARSLTTERHKTSEKLKGGFRKCL